MIRALTFAGFLLTITVPTDASVTALLQWFIEKHALSWARLISLPPFSSHSIVGLATTPGYGDDGSPGLSILPWILYLAISWYGWRRWQSRRRGGGDKSRLRTNEREFIVPFASRPDRFEQSDSEDES